VSAAAVLSKEEALELIRLALAMHDACRPTPAAVTVQQADEMLGVTTRTISRMKPPKHGAGRIPYVWVVEQLAVR
jgi:hypothetical protein